jgi:hypothetical protein
LRLFFRRHCGLGAAHDLEEATFQVARLEHDSVVTSFEEVCIRFDGESLFCFFRVVTGGAVVAKDGGNVGVKIWDGVLGTAGEREKQDGGEEEKGTHGVEIEKWMEGGVSVGRGIRGW